MNDHDLVRLLVVICMMNSISVVFMGLGNINISKAMKIGSRLDDVRYQLLLLNFKRMIELCEKLLALFKNAAAKKETP